MKYSLIIIVPDRVYTQGSMITSMAVNGDSSFMALGLKSGAISVFNLTTGIKEH